MDARPTYSYDRKYCICRPINVPVRCTRVHSQPSCHPALRTRQNNDTHKPERHTTIHRLLLLKIRLHRLRIPVSAVQRLLYMKARRQPASTSPGYTYLMGRSKSPQLSDSRRINATRHTKHMHACRPRGKYIHKRATRAYPTRSVATMRRAPTAPSSSDPGSTR